MFAPSVRLNDGAIFQFNHATVTYDLTAHRMAVEYMSYAQQQLLQMKRLGNKLFRADFKSNLPQRSDDAPASPAVTAASTAAPTWASAATSWRAC